jgi:hypothetical protein
MANVVECVLSVDEFSAELTHNYQDESVTELFKIKLDEPDRNIVEIAHQCAALQPLFPGRGASWSEYPGYGLRAKKFRFTPSPGLINWECEVTYLPLSQGESDPEESDGNPLAWPAVYTLDWIEYEEAVKEAVNLEDLGADTDWGVREEGTLDLVVNGALQEFEEGIFDAQRDAVIQITKNVATLDEIIEYQTEYQRTTNNATFLGAAAYRVKFLSAVSGGLQKAGDIEYYPMTISLQIMKTTDKRMNNIGWHHWVTVGGVKTLVKFKVDETDAAGNPTGEKVEASEPTFLTRGGKIGFAGSWVTYRYLTPKNYDGLLL